MAFSVYLLQITLLAAIVLVIAIPGRRGAFFNILLVSLILGWIIEFFGLITAQFGINNLFAYNVYSCIEVFPIYLLVYKANPQHKKYVLIALLISIATFAYSITVNNGFATELLTEGILVSGMLFVLLSLFELYVLAQTSSEVLYKHPYFWTFLGVLVYFGGFVPMIGSSQYITELDKDLAKTLYSVVPLLAVVRYSFAGYGAYLEGQARKARSL